MNQRYHDLTGDEIDAYLADKRQNAEVRARAEDVAADLNLCDRDRFEAAKLSAEVALKVAGCVCIAANMGAVKDQMGVQRAVYRMALAALEVMDEAMDSIHGTMAESDR
jgi:uncharacterized protein YfeS